MGHLLCVALPHFAPALSCLEISASAFVWRKDGSGVPFLSQRKDMVAVEPCLRRPRDPCRRCGIVQPGPALHGITRGSLARGIYLRSNPPVQRGFIPAGVVSNAARRVFVDLCAGSGKSRRKRGRGSEPGLWVV